MSTFYRQVLEAAAWTWLETFPAILAAGIAAMPALEWSALQVVAVSAALSAGAAALSVVKSMIVRNLGTPDSTLIN